MSKKFIITESEKEFILKMYGILKEHNETQPKDDKTNKIEVVKNMKTENKKSVFSKTVKVTFNSGYHSETYIKGKEFLDSLIEEVKQLISTRTKYATAKVVITVATGESKIPNYDRENNVKIGEKGLAKLRKKTIDQYISQKISPFLEGKGTIIINDVEPVITGPEWDANRYKTDENLRKEYEQAQFIEVKIDIFLTAKSYECLNGMTIELNYITGDHECNNAVFELYLDGEKLNRDNGKPYGNLNNAGIFDEIPNNRGGARYNKFVVSDEIAKKLVSKERSQQYLPLTIKCINAADVEGPLVNSKQWGDGCHTEVGNIIITPATASGKTILKGGTPRTRGQVNVLGYIYPCGGKYTAPQS